MDRQLSKERRAFLEQLVKAQMVIYENAHTGVSSGWFYWTLKMEGGAFAEWDFLRGVAEGWIPELPPPHESSESAFGDCQEIVKETANDMSIVHQYPPDPETSNTWPGPPIDDDYVLSVAAAEQPREKSKPKSTPSPAPKVNDKSQPQTDDDEVDDEATSPPTKVVKKSSGWHWFRWLATIFICYGIWHVFLKDEYGFGRSRTEYTPLSSATQLNI